MNRFDIYLAEVCYEDIEGAKIRPILILEDRKYIISCTPITSNTSRPEDYTIKRWKEAGLSCPSSIRLFKALDLEVSLIGKRLGKLHPVDILGVQNILPDS